jgi:mRNA interferase RelE/StbE
MKLIVSKKADKQLSKLNPFIRKKILKILRIFTKGERVDIKKMKGKPDEYRLRVGDYSILMKKFQSEDYLVTEIGKRENIYFFNI